MSSATVSSSLLDRDALRDAVSAGMKRFALALLCSGIVGILLCLIRGRKGFQFAIPRKVSKPDIELISLEPAGRNADLAWSNIDGA